MALFGRENQRDRERAEAYALWFRSKNPYALASIVLGIFSLIEMGVLIIFGVAGIVCGIIALRQITRYPATNGRGLAWAGIIISGVSLLIAGWLYWDKFTR